MTSNDDAARIDAMLKAGTLSAEQAERLRGSLKAQQERDRIYAQRSSHSRQRSHHRFAILFGALVLCFVLGITGGYLLLDNATDITATAPTAPAGTVNGQRPIDLSMLDQERSDTMQRTGTFSGIVILLIIFAALGVGLLLLYNGLVKSREQVNAGWAQVENVYQRRLDLVPLLIDGVKTYMEHERDTLTAVTEARARAIEVSGMLGGEAPQTVEQFKTLEASQGAVESALARLFAIVENYPDLKASQNFLALQDQMEGTENRIAFERRNYNEFARRFNTRTLTFPSNIVAELLDFDAKPYFQAENRAMESLKDPFNRLAE
ncbi:MAG: LemA family protein [Gammaproteobacteria bacterium]|nr:LemA family protein [Gammaproteobacteria bacterium]MDH3467928.1 LemA family protein [Gammaproteobacteria bacterium]